MSHCYAFRGSLFSYGLFLLLSVIGLAAEAQSFLESPLQGSTESGIGLIRGWVCDADRIDIVIDGQPPRSAAYGAKRGDTATVCGDDDNGFGLTFNWSALADGLHNLIALADGNEFANVDFRVATLGQDFLEGVEGEYTLVDFPVAGRSSMLRWSQAHQNFVFAKAIDVPEIADPPRNPRAFLESPSQGSFESGIGLIRGWVCEANVVEIVIDEGPALRAAYGTKRGATTDLCGDDNNGFGLTFNWNALSDGVHRLKALADGVAFADVNFVVTTLGLDVDFLEGVSGQYALPDFPSKGNTTTVAWSEPDQNFRIIGSNATTWWQPQPGARWQWQLSEVIDTSYDVDMYDIDLVETPAETIAQLHQQGRIVICYFSAGSWENYRPDAGKFPETVLGNTLENWPNERWLDISDLEVLGPLMAERLDLAVSKGCDGVEPDNVDGYVNDSGFNLSYQDQLNYNSWLANAAHARGLSVGLKNDLDQVQDLVGNFDWALNEQCVEYDECETLSPFVNAGKAVFGVEYQGVASDVCPLVNGLNFDWLLKNPDLDAERIACRGD
ncbi:MAG: endo alpha-1,4 polygalactosaminidase [Gammaproteobacteria bacterium]|nr:endo alpha-1,4 polygalactosaminidase [Gammaproteobacteria bacterium]